MNIAIPINPSEQGSFWFALIGNPGQQQTDFMRKNYRLMMTGMYAVFKQLQMMPLIFYIDTHTESFCKTFAIYETSTLLQAWIRRIMVNTANPIL